MISSKPLTIDANTFLAAKSVINFNSRFTQGDLKTTNLIQNAAKVLATPAGAEQAGDKLPALPVASVDSAKETIASKVTEAAKTTKVEGVTKATLTLGAGSVAKETAAVKTGGKTIETASGLKVNIGADGSITLG
jgi:hypothetical protein